MGELVPGGNALLNDGVLWIRVPGPFDLSVLITGEDGRVAWDGDFVFFNQPTAPGARLHGDTITLRPGQLRRGASRATVVISPADPGTPLGRLPAPTMTITGVGGLQAIRFTPPRPTQETVLLLAEIYRHNNRWKVRALGQGYAEGLAGVARDFGVDVADDGEQSPPPPPSPSSVTSPAGAAHDPDGFLGLVNGVRSRTGAPAVALDARLSTAARAHADAMAAQGSLGLESPDGTSVFHRIATAGYSCLTIAEHIVSGPRTAAEFVDYCLEDGERGAPFRDGSVAHVGMGRAIGGRSGEVFWTVLWARPFTAAGLARTADAVRALTNAERAAAGLPPLAPDPNLTVAAQRHSEDMVARDFYSHTAPEGSQPWDRAAAAGCRHRGIGENIACGQRTPSEVVRGWMNSPGHRANILKPEFSHIGIGYATGSRAGTYWTQLFGSV
ncbi:MULTISPECIES: CAP domain-containing protein [Streptomyces]|uniref:CAP domain-containing protein n=1 Tax=Streptomyces TaxID=1883 RepID=UPI0005B7B761|nr:MULTISPECIES: CAP domain-containing protein [Streptomyces]